MSTTPKQYNFPKTVIPKGKPVKAPKPKFPKPGIKPQKVAAVKPPKLPSAPKLKQPTVSYARTTKAR